MHGSGLGFRARIGHCRDFCRGTIFGLEDCSQVSWENRLLQVLRALWHPTLITGSTCVRVFEVHIETGSRLTLAKHLGKQEDS